MRYKLFELFFGTFVPFVAVHRQCFVVFEEVEIISLGRRKLQRYVPYTYLPVSKERLPL